MRFPRLPIAALVLATALTACSGDDEPKSEDPPPSNAGTDNPNAPGAEGPCRVEVEVTGAATASWKGKGTVRVGDADGPEAVYQAAKGADLLMLYSEGPGFPPSITATVGDFTFANEPGNAQGLEIQTDRTGAQIDVTAYNVEGAAANVVATFDCVKKEPKDEG